MNKRHRRVRVARCLTGSARELRPVNWEEREEKKGKERGGKERKGKGRAQRARRWRANQGNQSCAPEARHSAPAVTPCRLLREAGGAGPFGNRIANVI